jgi:hypothetical protein
VAASEADGDGSERLRDGRVTEQLAVRVKVACGESVFRGSADSDSTSVGEACEADRLVEGDTVGLEVPPLDKVGVSLFVVRSLKVAELVSLSVRGERDWVVSEPEGREFVAEMLLDISSRELEAEADAALRESDSDCVAPCRETETDSDLLRISTEKLQLLWLRVDVKSFCSSTAGRTAGRENAGKQNGPTPPARHTQLLLEKFDASDGKQRALSIGGVTFLGHKS